MNNETEGLRVSVSYSKKVNLGNYQSADIFVAVSGIEAGAEREEIEEALATADTAFVIVKARVDEKAQSLLGKKNEIMEGASR